MKIAVVGTGYVGLVTGTCFAETGNTVTCIDIDENKVKKLSSGEITIYEPGLEKIFLRNLKEDRLHFTTNLAEGIKDAAIIFLALPTPPGEDGSADLKYVLGVADDLVGRERLIPIGGALANGGHCQCQGGKVHGEFSDLMKAPLAVSRTWRRANAKRHC